MQFTYEPQTLWLSLRSKYWTVRFIGPFLVFARVTHFLEGLPIPGCSPSNPSLLWVFLLSQAAWIVWARYVGSTPLLSRLLAWSAQSVSLHHRHITPVHSLFCQSGCYCWGWNSHRGGPRCIGCIELHCLGPLSLKGSLWLRPRGLVFRVGDRKLWSWRGPCTRNGCCLRLNKRQWLSRDLWYLIHIFSPATRHTAQPGR